MASVPAQSERTLDRLVPCLQPGATVHGPTDRPVRRVQYDSRQVRTGDVFVAVPGAHVAGARFAADAARRGAAAVVTDDAFVGDRIGDATLILVPDARVALAQLACERYGHPSRALRLVGVTGTNGKTTTTYLVRHLLESAGLPTGLIGSIVYEFRGRRIPAQRTTPEAPDVQSLLSQMVEAGCSCAAMEVSSHGLAQHRVLGTSFEAVGFTNLTPEHLDFHGTIERYFEAKVRLFEMAAAQGSIGVVMVDDAWGRRLIERFRGSMRLLSYGLEPGADVRALEVSATAQGVRFRLESPWSRGWVELPLPGRFNVRNALAALTLLGGMGLDVDRACTALLDTPPVPGRMQRVDGPPGVQVFVDYAHTDDALRHALDALRELNPRRLWVVFGCGGDRDRLKRPRMGAVAVERCDRVVLTTDNPRTEPPEQILADIRAGCGDGGRVIEMIDRREAIRHAVCGAEPGDIVLVAGKGHEAYQEVGNTVLAFDDRDVIRDERRRCPDSGRRSGT